MAGSLVPAGAQREPGSGRRKVLVPGGPLNERHPTMERNGYGKVSLTGPTLGSATSRAMVAGLGVRHLPRVRPHARLPSSRRRLAQLALPSALRPPRSRLPGASFFFFPSAFLADEIQDLLDQHPHCVRCRL